MLYNDYFQNLLRKTNFSIKTIADNLGVSVGAVYKWKSGENRPQKHHVNKLAELEKQKIRWLNNEEIQLDTNIEKKGDPLMDNRLQNHLLDEIESLKALNIELTNQMKTLESKPPPKFSWTEKSVEKYAVELNADSTFQEIANELHIKSAQWNYLFDNINQPIGISRKGIIREVNQTYVDQFGYNRDEMIGKPIMDFIHPDEHERLKEVIASEKSDKIWRVMKKNGHYCRVHIQRQAFGDPDDGFSVALMKCVDEDCADID